MLTTLPFEVRLPYYRQHPTQGFREAVVHHHQPAPDVVRRRWEADVRTSAETSSLYTMALRQAVRTFDRFTLPYLRSLPLKQKVDLLRECLAANNAEHGAFCWLSFAEVVAEGDKWTASPTFSLGKSLGEFVQLKNRLEQAALPGKLSAPNFKWVVDVTLVEPLVAGQDVAIALAALPMLAFLRVLGTYAKRSTDVMSKFLLRAMARQAADPDAQAYKNLQAFLVRNQSDFANVFAVMPTIRYLNFFPRLALFGWADDKAKHDLLDMSMHLQGWENLRGASINRFLGSTSTASLLEQIATESWPSPAFAPRAQDAGFTPRSNPPLMTVMDFSVDCSRQAPPLTDPRWVFFGCEPGGQFQSKDAGLRYKQLIGENSSADNASGLSSRKRKLGRMDSTLEDAFG